MLTNRRKMRQLLLKTLSEGSPLPGPYGLVGLFSDDMSRKLMSLEDEDLTDEYTEELLDYPEDISDPSRQVVRSRPDSFIPSTPMDSINPYGSEGETYRATANRVLKTADDLQTRSAQIAADAAEKRKRANQEFKRNFSHDGTGVLPFHSSSEPAPIYSSEYYEDDSSLGTLDLSDIEDHTEVDKDEEPTFMFPEIEKEIEKTQKLNENDLAALFMSRGSLIRKKYYGRY